MKTTCITAHAGCEGMPDDSVLAVKEGIRIGADTVEVDVRMGPEGVLYLAHNERADFSGAERLEDALKLVYENEISINCDLKERRCLYPVIELAEKIGLPARKLIFSGAVSCELLASDASLTNRCRIFLNIEEICKFILCADCVDLGKLFRDPWKQVRPLIWDFLHTCPDKVTGMAKAVGAENINSYYKIFDHELIETFDELGMPLSLWTITDFEDQKAYIGEKLANITTRAPGNLLQLRSKL